MDNNIHDEINSALDLFEGLVKLVCDFLFY